MEQGYVPDGWLGFICGAKLFYDFSGKYPFEDKMAALMNEMNKVLKASHSRDHQASGHIDHTLMPDQGKVTHSDFLVPPRFTRSIQEETIKPFRLLENGVLMKRHVVCTGANEQEAFKGGTMFEVSGGGGGGGGTWTGVTIGRSVGRKVGLEIPEQFWALSKIVCILAVCVCVLPATVQSSEVCDLLKDCSCCSGTSCDAFKQCPNGCKEGYTGLDCKNRCRQRDVTETATRFYGSNCLRSCPKSCKNDVCDIKTGFCSDGCKDNFRGDTCTECRNGNYGINCEQTCPPKCLNETCDQISGLCDLGCQSGFSGDRCCVGNENCLQCENNGNCLTCKAGFYDDCSKQCIGHCTSVGCNMLTGHCLQCSGKFDGDRCISCSAGYYGEQCTTNCPPNCKNGICDQATGICLSGCKGWFDGDLCDNCHNGMYGENCSVECPCYCKDKVCYKESGACVYSAKNVLVINGQCMSVIK
ncbi:SREC-like protein, partial [Mya arenaria]